MAPAAVLPAVDLFAAQADKVVRQDYYSSGLRARFQLDAQRVAQKPPQEPYADISYDVDEEAFKKRAAARLAAGGLPTSVPKGWPTELAGSLVWSTDTADDESSYVYHLKEDDLVEIHEALETFKGHGLDGNEVSRKTFPLPRLSARLDQVCSDIYEGRGFAIVRGLNPDAYSVEDLTIVYLGISSYIGGRRGKQDQRGSMLMHVINRDQEERDRQFSQDKPFHTDTVTDVLCLFTQSLADTGGSSVISSAWTVYNELAATRPDLIHVLAASDWPFDTFGRNPAYYTRPVLFHHLDKVIMSFSRRLLVGHLPFDPRSPNIPRLTEAQAEALDAVHFIARKHEIKPRMVRGDLRFINNMAVLHRREAFENSAGAARHLVRLWLNNQDMCWKLPPTLSIAWARIFDDDGRDEHWDIEPIREGGKVLRVAGSCD